MSNCSPAIEMWPSARGCPNAPILASILIFVYWTVKHTTLKCVFYLKHLQYFIDLMYITQPLSSLHIYVYINKPQGTKQTDRKGIQPLHLTPPWLVRDITPSTSQTSAINGALVAIAIPATLTIPAAFVTITTVESTCAGPIIRDTQLCRRNGR